MGLEWMDTSYSQGEEFQAPRMFTLTQIKDLIHLHLTRSHLSKSFHQNVQKVDYHDDAIFDQGRSFRKFTTETSENFEKVANEIGRVDETIQDMKLGYNKRITDINRAIQIHDKKIMTLKDYADAAKQFQDMMTSKAEKLGKQLYKINKI